jgi:hypothetical protein
MAADIDLLVPSLANALKPAERDVAELRPGRVMCVVACVIDLRAVVF